MILFRLTSVRFSTEVYTSTLRCCSGRKFVVILGTQNETKTMPNRTFAFYSFPLWSSLAVNIFNFVLFFGVHFSHIITIFSPCFSSFFSSFSFFISRFYMGCWSAHGVRVTFSTMALHLIPFQFYDVVVSVGGRAGETTAVDQPLLQAYRPARGRRAVRSCASVIPVSLCTGEAFRPRE